MTDQPDKYAFLDVRTLKDGGPTSDECWGPMWQIVLPGKENDPVVVVPDPGDGSAKTLADKILLFLNNETPCDEPATS